MADIARTAALSWERGPLRGAALPARPYSRSVEAIELLRPLDRVAGDDRQQQSRAAWGARRGDAPHLSSAAFLAQTAAQDPPDPELPLRTRQADQAYRAAKALSVEFLGMHAPIDLRV